MTYLDNLRVVMVAGVIPGHAIAGCAGMTWTQAAFMFQGLPLIVVALLLRSFEVRLEVKALLVTSAAIAGSFALGWTLVTHARVGRIM